ncbi:DUF2071 domain-containing protein [Natronosporangium hydrolyticum]|uniref:DUF2071 domain-containing protein n=1 Tax=Natronosporangium hydrolyticum TaxID=2811111 RepID=A0A895Y5X1_9ACTN|nr:DUF2071 domain-containing protein [Natronosporangium hydrolyticum]QSB13127.1 DUF2071 domain-containing protein [Natronosporangium hydrolyticum]
MRQHWRWLTFLHWRYPAETVQALLPPGLRVQTYDGSAWVGLIPFLMDRVRLLGGPPLPGLSRFPETNVRTYVHGPDGRTGIWFCSLDAARLPAVVAARAAFGLPYYWAGMSVRRAGAVLSYRSRRRWPGRAGAGCELVAELGEEVPPTEVTELDHFLTARFRLYSLFAGGLATADADHPPWTLRRARVRRLRENLLASAGLPEPGSDPLCHASAGVPVEIGGWQRPRSSR